jgi:hypothetical protein
MLKRMTGNIHFSLLFVSYVECSVIDGLQLCMYVLYSRCRSDRN